MSKHAPIIGLTILMLILGDIAVALALKGVTAVFGPTNALVLYFDYGRSVPGKIDKWEREPTLPGNLLKVAWHEDIVARSAARFAGDPPGARVVRSYGMSFTNDILKAAAKQRPDLLIDLHSGPATPPNFAYAIYQDDRANRRPGDIVVLGVLASSLKGMGSYTNSTWKFEQPAPFTYPVYTLDGGALVRRDPVVQTFADFERLRDDADLRRRWQAQLRADDAFHMPATAVLSFADASPFLRLVRRYAVTYIASEREDAVLGRAKGGAIAFPGAPALRVLVADFARSAHADGQIPMVFLIQTQGAYPDLDAMLGDALRKAGVPYLATADIHPANEPWGFVGDGHFTDAVNDRLARRTLELMDAALSGEQAAAAAPAR